MRSRPASLNQRMATPISAAALGTLADEVIDWRFKGLPSARWGPYVLLAGLLQAAATAVAVALEHEPQTVEGEVLVVFVDGVQVG